MSEAAAVIDPLAELTSFTPSEDIRTMLATARDAWVGETIDFRTNVLRVLKQRGIPTPGRIIDSVLKESPVVKLHSQAGQVQIRGLSPSLAQCCRVLEHPEARRLVLGEGRLRFNELRQIPEFNGKEVAETELGFFMRDAELRVFGRDEKTGDNRVVSFQPSVAKLAFLITAKADSFHPVREWLQTLKPITGPSAIEALAKEAMGVSGLQARLLRMWMIGAVARVMKPACQLDTMLVLVEPKGGVGKSKFLRMFVNQDWFSESHLDLGGFNRKDALQQLHRAWIYAVPEMESARTEAARSRVKSFIDCPRDDYRAPYEATVRSHDRMVALIASRNPSGFLASHDDPAFDRRFWPVEIPAEIDLTVVANVKEDAWAEAYYAYLADETWHITDNEEQSTLRESQAAFAHHDAGETSVSVYLADPRRATKAVTTADVMRCALHLSADEAHRPQTQSVACAILRACGWEQKYRRWVPGGSPQMRWASSLYIHGRGRTGALEALPCHPWETIEPRDEP